MARRGTFSLPIASPIFEPQLVWLGHFNVGQECIWYFRLGDIAAGRAGTWSTTGLIWMEGIIQAESMKLVWRPSGDHQVWNGDLANYMAFLIPGY